MLPQNSSSRYTGALATFGFFDRTFLPQLCTQGASTMDKLTKRCGIRLAVAFLALALLLPAAIALATWTDDKPAQGDAKRSDLAKILIGAWTLAESESPSNPSGIGSRLKFFTGTHWMITQPDPKTGEVIFHHGGRYTLDGDTMAGSIDFANKSTSEFIGKTHKFKIKVDGDTFTQTALDNRFTEKWKRAR
jgi:hypothetical protein